MSDKDLNSSSLVRISNELKKELESIKITT